MTVDTTGGDVTATGTGAAGNDGIAAQSTGFGSTGNILVKTDAVAELNSANDAITATGATGSVTVQTNGAVAGGVASGTGIVATNTLGNTANLISVTAGGLVTGANGIDAGSLTTVSPVTVTAQQGVTSSAGFGVRAQGTTGAIMIGTTGGTVSSTGGDGVIALSTTGNIQIGTARVAAIGGDGINASSTTGGVVVTSGPVASDVGTGIVATNTLGNAANLISVTAGGLVTGVNGIDAGSLTTVSPVTVTAQRGVTSSAGFAVRAQGTTGPVMVETTGGTVSSTGGDGVIALSTTGNIQIGTATVAAIGGDGINASSTTGRVVVTSGPVASDIGTGVVATNTLGNAANLISVTAGGLVTGVNGIDAGSLTTVSPVTVTAQQGVTSSAGFGVRAQGTTGAIMIGTTGGTVSSTGGDGVIALSTTGNIQIGTARVAAIGGDGINASSTTGGIVVTSGPVASDIGTGVVALQTGAAPGGNVQVLPQSTVLGVIGINAAAVSTNNLTVTVGADVTGTAGSGIITSVAGGIANLNVNNPATTVSGTGFGFSGISSATGAGGLTNINVGPKTVVTDGLGRGVTLAAAGSGAANVMNSGSIVGAGSLLNPVVSIANATGAIAINNLGSGLIANNITPTAAANNAVAIFTATPAATGPNYVINSGTLIGAISLAAGPNVFTNLAGGQWVVSDGGAPAAAFGAGLVNALDNNRNAAIFAGAAGGGSAANFTGLQSLANAGTFNAGNSPTSVTNIQPNAGTAQAVVNTGTINVSGRLNFASLGTQAGGSTFTNGTAAGVGTINLSTFVATTARDGTAFPASTHLTTDVVTLGTLNLTGTSDANYRYTFGPAFNFADGPSSVLDVDTKVGAPGAASDRLVVSGTATGKTAINVWDTSSGAGSFNPFGITIVAVNGASSNAFFLASQTNPAHQTPGTPQFDLFEPSTGPEGAIKKGFFVYPLLQDNFAREGGSGGGSRYALFGLPDVEAFQLPVAMTAVQNIWNETVLTWLDRQDELRNCMRWSQGLNLNPPPPSNTWPLACASTLNLAAGTWHPGSWIKIGGASIDRTETANLGNLVPAAAALGNFDLGNKQDLFSVIGGLDVGTAAIFGPRDALVAQAMGGYLQSTLNFNRSPTSYSFTGATAGAGLTYFNSGFFADALFKADLLNYQTNFPTLATFGAARATGTATSFGGLGNIGYRQDFVDGLFHFSDYLEPIGTLSYVSTQFDRINFSGLTANFQNGELFRGALGLRVGSTFVNTPTYEVDASITGKYWRQFQTVNGVTLASEGTDLTLSDPYPRQFRRIRRPDQRDEQRLRLVGVRQWLHEVRQRLHDFRSQGRRSLSMVVH